MSQSTIYEVGTDSTPRLNFTLTDAAGDAVDLTGATTTFTGRRDVSDASTGFSVACTTILAGAGTCYAVLATTDTATAGLYECEIRVSWGAGTTLLTSKRFKLRIVATMTP